MDVPTGWISETELAAAIGVADEDRSTFHRNLVNWRYHGLLQVCLDGLVVPQVRPLKIGAGNEAWYPPVTLPMVRRINELRRQRPRDMDGWLWQLWLEAYPIDIIKWCRKRLVRLLARLVSGVDPKLLVEAGTRKPAKRSDPRRIFYRRLIARGWFALMSWSINVAIGARPPQSMFDPVSPPLAAFAKSLGMSPSDYSTIRDRLTGSPIEDMSIARLLTVLDEIQPAELEKVRQDCWVLSQAHRANGLIWMILSALWRRVNCRALLLPALIEVHRSPDHQDSLPEALRRYLPDAVSS